MRRPSFQFYPADWRNNAKLRRCGWEARGVWIEIMGLLHDSDTYGVLHWPLKEIAQAIGAPMKAVNELVSKGVLYGTEKGACTPMTYRPKSGRVEGEEVTLIEEQQGPVWYSPRMVRDEYVRTKRGESTRFGDAPSHSPKGGIGEGLNAPPTRRQGDGSSSSSSSSKIGKSSTSAEISNGALAGTGAGGLTAGTATDAQANGAVLAWKALRGVGVRCQPQDPNLLALVAENFTPKDMALIAAEKALKDARLWRDPDVHEELHVLLASGATQQQMYLTGEQYAAIKAAAAGVGTNYLASTLRGRRRDAEQAAAENAAGRKGTTRGKPPANASFEDTSYVGTPIDQLPPELRPAPDPANA